MPASVHAKELADALGVAEQLGRRAGVDDAADVEHDDLLRDPRDDGEILLDEEHGRELGARSSAAATSVTSSGASPFVGSSTSRTGLSFRSARAIATICCWPPESVPARWPPRVFSSGKSS